MMHWLGPAMWGFCRIVAFICQMIGFAGILLAALLALRAFCVWIEP